MRFYGMSLADCKLLQLPDFYNLIESMNRIEASEQLLRIEAGSITNMKKDSREKIVNKHISIMTQEKKKIYSMDEAVRFLQNGK